MLEIFQQHHNQRQPQKFLCFPEVLMKPLYQTHQETLEYKSDQQDLLQVGSNTIAFAQ
jgi:hypothetical protein